MQSYRHQKKVFEGKAGWEIDVNLDVCGISCSSASGCKTWKGKPNVIEKKTKKMGIRCWILFIMLHIFLIYLLIYVYTHTPLEDPLIGLHLNEKKYPTGDIESRSLW